MLALQNIKYIFIRATDSVDFTTATLVNDICKIIVGFL